jgi:hypothetical protein
MQYKKKLVQNIFSKRMMCNKTIHARPCPFGCKESPIIQFVHSIWLKHFTMHLCCSRIVFPLRKLFSKEVFMFNPKNMFSQLNL